MNGLFDTPCFLKEFDIAEEQLDKSRINNLGDMKDLVNDEFEKYYNPSDIVLKYIDLLMKAYEGNNMNKRSELNSKLKSKFLLLSVSKFLIDGDLL